MQIFIKDNNVNVYDVNSDDTLYSLYNKIQKRIGVDINNFYLTWNSRGLYDFNKTIKNCGITRFSTLYLLFRPN